VVITVGETTVPRHRFKANSIPDVILAFVDATTPAFHLVISTPSINVAKAEAEGQNTPSEPEKLEMPVDDAAVPVFNTRPLLVILARIVPEVVKLTCPAPP
jgi:hypothetical protein